MSKDRQIVFRALTQRGQHLKVHLPGIVEIYGRPRSAASINVSQVVFQPDPLLAALGIIYIVAQEDVVGGPHIHRIEEV